MSDQPLIRIVTHDGPFHADEVLSVAILSTIFKNHQIIRTREIALIELGDIVVDVGGRYDPLTRRYDHHMPQPPMDDYNQLYSSAGLIWRHYARAYLKAINIPTLYTYKTYSVELSRSVERIIKSRWIIPIDRGDNGISNTPTPISDLVSNMTPIAIERSSSRFDELFMKTVSMVSFLFERACFHAADFVIAKTNYAYGDKEYLMDDKILVADTEVRDFGSFSNTQTHFVIYPAVDHTSGLPYYIIRPIYESTSKIYKTPFPKKLLGLTGADLEEHGVLGIRFIHHSGFTAKALSKDAAIDFCSSLLSE